MFKIIFALLISLPIHAQDFKKEGLLYWEKRDVKESLESAIDKFEAAHKKDNWKDIDLTLYLIRGNFILADVHTSDEEKMKEYLLRGRDFGIAWLSNTNVEFKKLVDKGEDIEDAVKVLSLKDAPVTFWTAISIGRWAKINGIIASARVKNQIINMVKNVEALLPDYYHGAVPRFWGSYYAAIPRIAGGDLKKSKKYFETSIKMAPEYFATKVLMAEIYCVEKEDKKLFKKLLGEVIAAENTNAELIPENNIEKKKAQALLDKSADLF